MLASSLPLLLLRSQMGRWPLSLLPLPDHSPSFPRIPDFNLRSPGYSSTLLSSTQPVTPPSLNPVYPGMLPLSYQCSQPVLLISLLTQLILPNPWSLDSLASPYQGPCPLPNLSYSLQWSYSTVTITEIPSIVTIICISVPNHDLHPSLLVHSLW